MVRFAIRQLLEISQDLLKCEPQALLSLKQLPPSEVPKEEVVREGMWIEEAERTIGIWGGRQTKAALPLIEPLVERLGCSMGSARLHPTLCCNWPKRPTAEHRTSTCEDRTNPTFNRAIGHIDLLGRNRWIA